MDVYQRMFVGSVELPQVQVRPPSFGVHWRSDRRRIRTHDLMNESPRSNQLSHDAPPRQFGYFYTICIFPLFLSLKIQTIVLSSSSAASLPANYPARP